MKTYLDCIPCFFKQALEAARMAGADDFTQKKIIDAIARAVVDFPLSSSPPEMGRIVYGVVKRETKNYDPYKEIKEKSNNLALSFLPELKQKIEKSGDRLLTALKLSILGNIIDYGVKSNINVEKEMEKIIKLDFNLDNREEKEVFDYQIFKDALRQTESILYLADNAGEVVFDRLLIEEFSRLNKEIIYVVRDKPVINDALIEDAKACGIDKYAHIISSGVDTPGTILNLCSGKFLKIFQEAKLIISKGQGNFEALSGEEAPIFFLFKVKCPIVAQHIGCKLGEMILKAQQIPAEQISVGSL